MLKVLTRIEELFEERKVICKSFEMLNSRFFDPEFTDEDDYALERTQFHLVDIDKSILDIQPTTINDVSIMAYIVKFWMDVDEEDESLSGFDAKLTRYVAAFFPLEV
jgi:hypothetical protein